MFAFFFLQASEDAATGEKLLQLSALSLCANKPRCDNCLSGLRSLIRLKKKNASYRKKMRHIL